MFKYYLLSLTAQAVDIAGALENIFKTQIQPQLKAIGNLALLIITGVLLLALVFRGVFVWREYQRSGGEDMKWGSLLVLFICLVIAASASAWMWTVIGW